MSMPGFVAEAALTERSSGSCWVTDQLDRPAGRNDIHPAAWARPSCSDRYEVCMSRCSNPDCACFCHNQFCLCTGKCPLEPCL
jgi:hypothetical protein